MRRVLVTSQVAFALMLLIGAGVLLASFDRVLTIDPGFSAEQRADRHHQPAGLALPADEALRAAAIAHSRARFARCPASRPPA